MSMNHLPFDWSDAVDDDHVVAHFIGGGWDGKTYAIPDVEEWKIVALMPQHRYINKPPAYDLAVYKQVVRSGREAIYWFTRIEKAHE